MYTKYGQTIKRCIFTLLYYKIKFFLYDYISFKNNNRLFVKVFKIDVFHRQSRERFIKHLEDDVDDHKLAMAYSLLEDLIDMQPLPKIRGGSVPGRLAYRKRG